MSPTLKAGRGGIIRMAGLPMTVLRLWKDFCVGGECPGLEFGFVRG